MESKKVKSSRKRYLSRSRLKMIEVRRKGLESSLSSSSSSSDPGTARPQLPTTSSVGAIIDTTPQLPTDSAVDIVAVEPQLPTVSTDCSVEMVGTEEGEDECCSDAASACSSSSGSDYVPPGEMGRLCVSPVDLGNQMFVGLTSQLQEFFNGMNEHMRCRTEGCTGKYVPIKMICEGLGGAIVVEIACDGCQLRSWSFRSSPTIEGSQRTLVSLALQVAFYAWGSTHSQYFKILKRSLGINAVTVKPFYDILKLMYPKVLEEMCGLAITEMAIMEPSELGSIDRAVTTSDGVWLTRRHFSQNHTFYSTKLYEQFPIVLCTFVHEG